MAASDAIDEMEVPEQRGLGLGRLVKAAAVIAVLVVVEVVLASMLIPSARDTEALAVEFVAAESGATPTNPHSETSGSAAPPAEDIREVMLGDFSVTRFDPETGKTLTVDVELHASLLAEEQQEFQQRFEQNKGRVGEQVIMTLHAADTADLSDAELGLIKRKILEKTNRALGKPLVREVLFSKFNFVER
jgi:flagellar FliL protein